jgi:DNA polymerase sigma
MKYKNLSIGSIQAKTYYSTAFHIYIDEPNSRLSSQIIGQYALHPYVKDFCMIIKLWGKRRYISGALEKGLNGYILTVMAICYLVHTGQAPGVIAAENQYVLETPIDEVPEFRNLFENVRGWMEFYR